MFRNIQKNASMIQKTELFMFMQRYIFRKNKYHSYQKN